MSASSSLDGQCVNGHGRCSDDRAGVRPIAVARMHVGASMRPVWPRPALGFVAMCKRRQDHDTYNPPSTPHCGAFLATQIATA
jgi:hypothetical protein